MTVFAISLEKVSDPGVRDAFTATLRLIQQLQNSISSVFSVGTPSGVIDGVNATFTLLYAPLLIFKNGVLQSAGSDYTLSGLTMTYLAGAIPVVGDTHAYAYYH